MNLNTITISGRLGQKPILRKFPSGEQVADFTVAHTRYRKDRGGGQAAKFTDWFDCSIWGRPAEILCTEASKGQVITISGSLALERVHSEAKGHEVTVARIAVQAFELGRMPHVEQSE